MSYILASCLVTDGRVVACGLQPPLLEPCHIICQVGSGLENVEGVPAMFLEPTFKL